MIFNKTPLEDAYLIDLDRIGDSRGFFARIYCADEFRSHGLVTSFVQVNNSLSAAKGTLRGLHYQLSPRAETKLVRCIRGAIWDVILDLRPSSPTHGRWFGSELSAQNRRMMYVPKGFAHGFVTLTDDAEVFYFVDEVYSPEHERGIRWDDPKFKIKWPMEPLLISDKDQAHPDYDPGAPIPFDSQPDRNLAEGQNSKRGIESNQGNIP